MIRNNQNRRRRGGNNNNGPRPQQMNGGNNYGARLDNRQRGNASQLLEKYRALARDAQQAGDRVTAEYYLQYADHYYRVLGDYREKAPAEGRQRGQNFYEDDSAGYAASGDESDEGDEEQDDRTELRGQDDRGENRGDGRSDGRHDGRTDDARNQWRDDRGNQNGNQNNSRNRDAQRDVRQDSRPDSRVEPRNEPRGDGNRNEGRDRQAWNGNGAPRSRDDNRDDNRSERPRDENRADRPREDSRGDRNINRDRRPGGAQRPSTGEAAATEARQAEPRMADEGPIPGLPGPATLRMKRTGDSDREPQTERAPRTARPPVADEPVVAAVADAIAAPTSAADGDAVAPRRRGRPRKVVESAPAES